MPLIGYTAAITLTGFITAKDIASKKLSSTISGTLSTFAQFAFAIPYYLLMLPILWWLGWESFVVTSSFFTFIALRALSDTGAEWTKMESISRGDLSLVSAFHSLSPAFLAVLSPTLTGDPISSRSMLGLFVITGAGIILARPWKKNSSEQRQTPAILLAVAAAFFFSINHCIDRLAVQTSSAPLAAFAMTLIAAVMVFPAVLWKEPKFRERLESERKPLLVRGFFETFGMVAKLLALQYLTAPTVVAISRLAVPVSILLAALIFKEKQLAYRLTWGTVMAIGCMLVALG